jgi:UDP-glucose 4-epimerase
MRAMVTGAAGFIGSRLAAALLDQGGQVVGIDAFRPAYDPARKRRAVASLDGRRGWELVPGDVADLPLDELLEGVDVVFHLAARANARASWRDDFDLYLHDNVRVTQAVLHAAHAAAVSRVVLASSSSVYGNATALPTAEDAPFAPISPYGATKVMGETLARTYGAQGLDVVCLRYFTVYGPGQRPDMALHRAIDASIDGGELPLYGDGRQTRDFTFVHDAVAGTIAAAEHGRPGQVYNLGGGSRVSLNEALGLVAELAGAAARVLRAPAQAGDARDTWADATRARRELGFEPRHTLRDGLAEQMAWQRAARVTA